MDEILAELEEKIENNQYYLDNFDFMVETYKNFNEVLDLFSKNKGNPAAEKLCKITRFDLIKLYVLYSRFYDSNEEHDEMINLISYLMHDGKNLQAKKTKFEILEAIAMHIVGQKNYFSSKSDRKKFEKLKNIFIEIYGEDNYLIYEKICEDEHFLLFFNMVYFYFDIIYFDYENYDLVGAIEVLRNENFSELIGSYIEDDEVRTLFTIVNFDSLFGYIYEKVEKYRKELRSIRKENSKLITKAQKLRELYNKKDKELISTQDLKGVVDDSDESFKILTSLAKSNSEIVSKIEENFGKKEQIIYALYNYHYNYDEIASEIEKDIENIDISILKENLDRLSKNGINVSNENLIYIIKNNSLINVDNVKPFIAKSYINTTIINRNIRILTNEDDFSNYFNNIKLLETFNINVLDIVNGYYEFLLINNNYLTDIFNLCKMYGLKLDSYNIIILLDTLSFDNIDLFIEEGYSDYIVNNVNLLEKGDVIPKRLHINNLVNSDLVETNSIDEDVLNEGSFFVSDRCLDDACSSKTYLYQNKEINTILNNSLRLKVSEDIINSDIVLKLDAKYRNEDVYDFDGVIISRCKVLRNLEALKNTSYSVYERVLNSIIYNSLLGIDDLKTISSEIKNTFGTFKNLK